jgi:branched-chain amino acid transport system substrate-binding protein
MHVIMLMLKRKILLAISVSSLVLPLYSSQYDVGASDSQIKIGNTAARTGSLAPLSAYVIAAEAYFEKINTEEGGINNRKIVFIAKDDVYDPAKTIDLTKNLIEHERVLFIFLPLGTPTTMATKEYLNKLGIPQIFTSGGIDEFYEPQKTPWTISGSLKYSSNAKHLAQYLLDHKPQSKVAILYFNSDFGKSVLKSFKEGLGDKAASMVVKEVPIRSTDVSVQFPMQVLKSSGADVFVPIVAGNILIPIIQQAHDSGWKPTLLLAEGLGWDSTMLEEAGFNKVVGAVSAEVYKDPSNPRWKDDKGVNDYKEFMKKYYPDGDVNSKISIRGYVLSQLMVLTLKKAGDNLTRQNIMNLITNMHYTSADIPMLLPGVEIHTTPEDYEMFSKAILMQFDGHTWNPVN